MTQENSKVQKFTGKLINNKNNLPDTVSAGIGCTPAK